MAQIKFIVEGMTCGHCASTVEKSLGEIDGVSTVDVDLQTGEVAVRYDETKTNVSLLKKAVEDIGFDVG